MDEITSKCSKCGASVYKQHIDSGIARYEDGQLMCAPCVAEYEKAHDGDTSADDSFAPIAFDDDDVHPRKQMSASRIHGATASTLGTAGTWNEAKFKRPLHLGPEGATRCRTFHCKLSEAAIEFMQTQINDWLDRNDGIIIKFATSAIGPFEGKHTEQNLILSLFY